MNIGDAAQHVGLPAKTIRYYEEIGLVIPQRGAKGYRQFSARDLHNLTFLARSRALGFSIEDCRALLTLYQDDSRASADVRQIARNHLTQIDQKISDLQAMAHTLNYLISECAGNDRPECPILTRLDGSDQVN
ncbi:MAG: Cu(I)-responsive transcriptional regulator [Pseudoruegeria sp.]